MFLAFDEALAVVKDTPLAELMTVDPTFVYAGAQLLRAP